MGEGAGEWAGDRAGDRAGEAPLLPPPLTLKPVIVSHKPFFSSCRRFIELVFKGSPPEVTKGQKGEHCPVCQSKSVSR